MLAAATPSVVEHARQAVRRLTPPNACHDTRLAELEASLPLPDDPLVVGALRERLSQVVAEALAGQCEEALVRAEALQVDADAAGYMPLIAEVALRRGEILARLNRFVALQLGNNAALSAVEPLIYGQRAKHIQPTRDREQKPLHPLATEYSKSVEGYLRQTLRDRLQGASPSEQHRQEGPLPWRQAAKLLAFDPPALPALSMGWAEESADICNGLRP